MGRGDVPFDRDSDVLSDISDSESKWSLQCTANTEAWVGLCMLTASLGVAVAWLEDIDWSTSGEGGQLFLKSQSFS